MPVKGLFEVYEDTVEILLMLQVFFTKDPILKAIKNLMNPLKFIKIFNIYFKGVVKMLLIFNSIFSTIKIYFTDIFCRLKTLLIIFHGIFKIKDLGLLIFKTDLKGHYYSG